MANERNQLEHFERFYVRFCLFETKRSGRINSVDVATGSRDYVIPWRELGATVQRGGGGGRGMLAPSGRTGEVARVPPAGSDDRSALEKPLLRMPLFKRVVRSCIWTGGGVMEIADELSVIKTPCKVGLKEMLLRMEPDAFIPRPINTMEACSRQKNECRRIHRWAENLGVPDNIIVGMMREFSAVDIFTNGWALLQMLVARETTYIDVLPRHIQPASICTVPVGRWVPTPWEVNEDLPSAEIQQMREPQDADEPPTS